MIQFLRKSVSLIVIIAFNLGLFSSFTPGPIAERVALAAPTATTWYVDAQTGDDGDDCLTPGTACLTVGAAVGKASSGDTIQIAAGTYVENLDINFDLAFVGAGMDATFLDGGQAGRVLVAASSSITVANLTIQNGSVSGSGVAGKGAGIFNYNHLVLDNVRVVHNTSQDGGAGIFTSGRLLIQNSEVISNTTQGGGGGLEIWSTGALTLTESLVAWNEASTGGGVFNTGQFFGQSSTLWGNQSGISGGGLVNSSTGVVDLVGFTVSENQTDGYGAGLLNELGSMSLTNVTVSRNRGSNYVGVANINETAQITITNSTIAENIVTQSGIRYGGVVNLSGLASLLNTIVANNDSRQCLANASWVSLGSNLSSDSYCAFTQPGDDQNIDPLLAPLADYGGATLTHALQPGSPAIDTANNAGCPADDQRGVSRPFDGDNDGAPVCDKGAFEARNQLVLDDLSLVEGNTGTVEALFTVTLSPTSTQEVTVDYFTADGTANAGGHAGSDYQAASGQLVFAPGEATQAIAVQVNGDTQDETDETFFVNLSAAGNADILDGVGVATIVDDDGLPALTIADAAITEGNSGAANAFFVVALSPAHTQQVTVDYTTQDGTASAGSDYTAASGTLTFEPGVITQTISVAVSGDLVDEGETETFSVLLSSPVNAQLADEIGEGSILDDDIATVSIQNSQPVMEGDSGETSLTFTVTLSLATAFPVTVDYYTQSGVGGTFATPGVDYEDVSGTLTFAPGEMVKTFTVPIYGDLEDEQDENFSAFLINAVPISIYGSASTGYILDDDDLKIFLPITMR
jgi:hypothetical protein